MKIGLLIEGGRLARWQADALRQIGENVQLIVYNCRHPATKRRPLRHAFYYLLNMAAIRNPLTRVVPVEEAGLQVEKWTNFPYEHEGAWQRLPDTLLDQVVHDAPELIVKFSSSLLKVPDQGRLGPTILSFHHGDPRHFRGRPAGFYEILKGAPVLGQIVQILSNRLDAGKVVGFGETNIHRHSYRATLMEAYQHSALLLPQAIRNVCADTALDILPTGRVYRLPGNLAVLSMVGRIAAAKIRRLVYGAFFEKAWKVSLAPLSSRGPPGSEVGYSLPRPENWRTMNVPPGYTFLADPFFDPRGEGLLVEALNAKTGLGELLSLNGDATASLSNNRCHHSYPGWVRWEGRDYLVPEVSEWSTPLIYGIDADGIHVAGTLDVAGNPPLVDPTLFIRDGFVYLFANRSDEGTNVLRLWLASSLFGRFEEHRKSPIRISPVGSRMAGAIVQAGDLLCRLGQDGSQNYGDGIVQFRVGRIDQHDYAEEQIGQLRFEHVRGPHTLNFSAGEAAFDWYVDRFSLSAGVRRVRGRLARR